MKYTYQCIQYKTYTYIVKITILSIYSINIHTYIYSLKCEVKRHGRLGDQPTSNWSPRGKNGEKGNIQKDHG